MKILRSRQSRRDLIDIIAFLASQDRSTAEKLLDRLERVLLTLKDQPRSGRLRPELGPDVRSTAFRGYVLFYRIEGDSVRVDRILDGRRDISSLNVP